MSARFLAPVRLEYTVTAGRAQTRFFHGLLEGRIVGLRCGSCQKVYVPARVACPTCVVPFAGEVDLSGEGTVTTFCIVRIPFQGQRLPPPYVAAAILLDGADIPLFHLIGGVGVDDVRMGMRVRAVWLPPADRKPSLEAIDHFRPTGAPDAPFPSYAEHL